MSAEGAAAVIGRFEERGVDVWLEGGWGIDALVGRETREHDDLDVIVPLEYLPALEPALRELGYRFGFADGPLSFEVVDDEGHQIDVHPIARRPNGDAVLFDGGRPRVDVSGRLAHRPRGDRRPCRQVPGTGHGPGVPQPATRWTRRISATWPRSASAMAWRAPRVPQSLDRGSRGRPSLHDEDPRPLRRDGRAGRRAQRELPRVVRGRARRVPRAVRRGLFPALQEHGIEAFVAEAHVRYGVPARFDDRLELHARVVDVRGARFRFEYRLERDGDLVAEGWTAHACVDATTHRPTRVPAWLADAIRRAEESSRSSSSS